MNNKRLPAYPLFISDPYFSIWASDDVLNGNDTMFWTGHLSPVQGVVFVDGKCFSFLGKVDGATNLIQESVSITAFSTDYKFTHQLFDLEVSFISPLLPTDLETLSCPVCYFRYEISPKTELNEVTVGLIVNEKVCYEDKKPILGGVVKMLNYEVSYFGLRRQTPLSHIGDGVKAEWGYYYLTGNESFYLSQSAYRNFIQTGNVTYELIEDEEKYILAIDKFSKLGDKINGMMLLAFDDICSINYFGEFLKGYFFRDGKTIFDSLEYSFNNYPNILNKLKVFDDDLKKRAKKYGEDYLFVLYTALRQVIGAHKLVENRKGEILFLSKECYSNGCIATVDVSYPSTPLFLLYNPELVRGMLRPIFTFAKMDVWPFEFAPHDGGTYPFCCGQTYGLNHADNRYLADSLKINWTKKENFPFFHQLPKHSNIYNFNRQMPVEECGNMLIMSAATMLADNHNELIKENYQLLENWANYLYKYGLKPGSQLCTDDFAGHLDGNINLSIKTIVALMAFSIMSAKVGNIENAHKFNKIARDFSLEWHELLKEDSHTPLSFYSDEDNFSLKYNMAFDILFGTNLFSNSVKTKEIKEYLNRMNHYGVPLDSRKTYTKSDWLLWVSLLTNDLNIQKQFITCISNFLTETNDRVPFSDWFDTINAKKMNFQNRTVQGGLFILLLADTYKLQYNEPQGQ